MLKSFVKMPLLLALLAALLSVGCFGGSTSKAQLKDQYIEQQINSYVYRADFQRVWAEARSLLFTRGFQIRDSGNGYTVETEWSRTSTGQMRRYLVTGYVNQDGSSTVRFDFFEESPATPGYPGSSRSGRDYVIEAELIQRVEPNAWSQINMDAQVYAENGGAH